MIAIAFLIYAFLNKNLNNYDAIQFSVTPENYQIEAIAGINYEFQNKRKECYRKMEKIFDCILGNFSLVWQGHLGSLGLFLVILEIPKEILERSWRGAERS